MDIQSRDFVVYAAGLFDGEGCVALYVHQHSSTGAHLNLHVSIANTYRRVIELVNERWPGSIVVNISDMGTKRRKPCYLWKCSAKKAQAFLEDVLPFLIVKKQQAELALEYRSRVKPRGFYKSGNPMPPEEAAERMRLMTHIAELKRA